MDNAQASEKAMKFVVKWHQALGLDPFGCRILAKAIDELLNELREEKSNG